MGGPVPDTRPETIIPDKFHGVPQSVQTIVPNRLQPLLWIYFPIICPTYIKLFNGVFVQCLYSVLEREVNEYWELVEWYWQDKPKYPETNLNISQWHSFYHKSHIHWSEWNTFLRGQTSIANRLSCEWFWYIYTWERATRCTLLSIIYSN